METALDEAGAIVAARNGDGEAFRALVERYQDAGFRAAYLIVRDAAAAEDVAQEAFIRAYRSLRSFRDGEPFRPWLLRIVTNLALNEVRGRGRRGGLFARVAGWRSEPVASPEGAVLAGEGLELLSRAINELPADDRVILYLRYFLELPEREIAIAIDRPPGTVKSRLHRASARLRDVIERRYPTLRPQGVSDA